MVQLRESRYVCAALVAAMVLAVALPAAAQFAGVSLKASGEEVPPGAIAQLKLFVTEPKPISTGLGAFSLEGLGDVDGIALLSPADDTFGVAVVIGTALALSVVSPSATFGTASEYPVLMIAARLPLQTPMGTVIPFRIDSASLKLRDPSGAIYPMLIEENGSVTAARAVSIDDVLPGSADLPKGATVTILGTGFVPATEVRFNDIKLSQVRYVNASRIDVVLGSPARMHGLRIRVRNPDGARTTYFSYQRTRRSGSSLHPVLRTAMPLMPRHSVLTAIVDLPGTSAGLALQNIQPSPATVTAELLAANGTALATVQLNLPANQFIVQELSELFRFAYSSPLTVRVRAGAPIQVMGISVDALGNATPRLPR